MRKSGLYCRQVSVCLSVRLIVTFVYCIQTSDIADDLVAPQRSVVSYRKSYVKTVSVTLKLVSGVITGCHNRRYRMPLTGPKGPQRRNRQGRQTTECPTRRATRRSRWNNLDESQIEVADVGRQMRGRQAVGVYYQAFQQFR